MKTIIKKITAIVILLAISFTNTSTIMAQETTDNYLTVTLSNGQEKQINQNPYGAGVTSLEYKIIEAMQSAAQELGVDLTQDKTYQWMESVKYETLSGNTAYRDAKQVDFAVDVIKEVKEKLQNSINSKKQEAVQTESTSSDALIKEGIFKGFTEAEKEELFVQVFNQYVTGELLKIRLYDRDIWFGARTAEYMYFNTVHYDVPNGSVMGDNYIVRDYFIDESEKKAMSEKMQEYFNGQFEYEKFMAYPQDDQLSGNIDIHVNTRIIQINSPKFQGDLAVYYFAEDGTAREIEFTYSDTDNVLSFRTSDLGYYAWGIKNKSLQTPDPTSTPATTPSIIPNKAPKTSDSNNVVFLFIAFCTSGIAFLGLNKKRIQE